MQRDQRCSKNGQWPAEYFSILFKYLINFWKSLTDSLALAFVTNVYPKEMLKPKKKKLLAENFKKHIAIMKTSSAQKGISKTNKTFYHRTKDIGHSKNLIQLSSGYFCEQTNNLNIISQNLSWDTCVGHDHWAAARSDRPSVRGTSQSGAVRARVRVRPRCSV